MRIQIIEHQQNKRTSDKFTISSFNHPQSLDEFDVNIIKCNSKSLWECNNGKPNTINSISDFIHLSTMIKNSKSANHIIVVPQNIHHQYDRYSNTYCNKIEIKNNLPITTQIISVISSLGNTVSLVFEPTKTLIGNNNVDADFHFDISFTKQQEVSILTTSEFSKKITTIRNGENIFTTLDIHDDNIMDFLTQIGLYRVKDVFPQWLLSTPFLNDQEQNEIIAENKIIIDSANNKISSAQNILDENNEYKSILVSNGDQLVSTVFKILQQLLHCDLSGFKDIKKEDFAIPKDEVIFIGEIKGESSGVTAQKIRQIANHVDDYHADHPDEVLPLKGIFIVNSHRQKPLEEREKVHIERISQATRENVLIIETIELLRLFEKFKRNEITPEQCIAIFQTKTGLLKTNDILS